MTLHPHDYPHSHDWRDIRFIGKLVKNVRVAPIIQTDPREPGNYMRPGQRYRCTECKREILISEAGEVVPVEAPTRLEKVG